ncbi:MULTISPECIES: class I SAM-dependent methyltransferase [Corynebacterium]|uniref:SAM-dependent methyltransferase n=2 Tax=Corynebacterium TaxID=1716 RepID=A0A269PFJ9_9CORY|nr:MULTISPECIES: class I SAM-dependent methyltransferase [Corynebacterium]PAJ70886.1 SAM-dependent methyltransferase [Corynebacterium hadale]PAT13758.1 SAM-dependent methyltransferase [Corynebacterium hadale]RMD17912.1 class I SAM-dependent methyltransferase [Corynebacterium gottingense]TVX75797.1 class I SAM-dependent methyltransferase [Corynebacterium sp. NML180780]WJZ13826.1 putative S-adenosylmethionine-dependent methyltransferase [Corynebacterium gottingense]
MPTWKDITTANPAHSENYAQRWKAFVAQGKDIDGEARLIDATVPRHARILDAGCGTGRVGGYLARRGHEVIGTDLDPILIGHAKEDFPDATWLVGDLSEDEIPAHDIDVAVCAGNVMGFLDPAGRAPALENIFRALRPGGRLFVGFGAGRGWSFDDFLTTAKEAGFAVQYCYESWDLQPFTQDSAFLVAQLARPASGQ